MVSQAPSRTERWLERKFDRFVYLPKGGESMFTQLNPTLPLHVLDRGEGYAVGVIDYGQEHNLIWVTVLNESGEVWCAPNTLVRFGKNWTMGRGENPLIAKDKQARSSEPEVDEICEGCKEKLAR